MIKEAIILAGGKGTRLKSKVSNLPKPMADINGKPFLTYLFNYLIKEGIERVILAVGYQWEKIQAYYGENYKDLELIYSVEKEALGTGGGIALASQKVYDEDILVINGDTYFPISISDLYQYYKTGAADLSMGLKALENTSRYGRVNLKGNGQICGFEEKGREGKGLINGGIYLFQKTLLDNHLKSAFFSFETEILQKLYQSSYFSGLRFESYFIDIGIPEDYEQFQKDISRK